MFYMFIYEKKCLSQIFFQKNFKKIRIFSEVNPLEKLEKTIVFFNLKFGNLFSKTKL